MEFFLGWAAFFMVGWGVPLVLYVLLQAGALLGTEGRWRVSAAVPVPMMVIVCAHMAWAYAKESNLWPMTMLMTTPGAILAVLIVWTLALLRTRRWKVLVAPIAICAGAGLAAHVGGHGLGLFWAGEQTLTIAGALVTLGVVASQVPRLWAAVYQRGAADRVRGVQRPERPLQLISGCSQVNDATFRR